MIKDLYPWGLDPNCLQWLSAATSEACIGVLGKQDICHFTSRDIIGYCPFSILLPRICDICIVFIILFTNNMDIGY